MRPFLLYQSKIKLWGGGYNAVRDLISMDIANYLYQIVQLIDNVTLLGMFGGMNDFFMKRRKTTTTPTPFQPQTTTR